MRLPALPLALALAVSFRALPLAAQPSSTPLTRADSVLVYAILSAEDRRDAADSALARGASHADPRIALIARRAQARLTDSTFAARATLGQPAPDRPFPTWPEPAWAARYRALGGREGDCAPLLAALSDSAAQVRQRAIALSGQRRSCAGNAALRSALVEVVRSGSGNVRMRRPGQASWQLAAEAMLAVARQFPDDAGAMRQRLQRHNQPQLRRAAARAAAIAKDSSMLRAMLRDQDPNVLEAALQGLSATVGHGDDRRYVPFLTSTAPQVALAAAEALAGSRDSSVLRAADAELARRTARQWASERDVRNALRAVLGQPSVEAWQPGRPDSLPFDVVGLALGERRYVQVVFSRLHGGRAFTVELRGDIAPIQAARVLAQVRAHDYNGTRWHRVEPNFVIQGGSPHDNEYSGSGRFVVDELSTVPHPRGSVGMSTRGHSTGDLQWFVNLRDNARLMPAYTVFAAVVEGMDVVDDVMEGDEIYVMREVSAPRPRRP